MTVEPFRLGRRVLLAIAAVAALVGSPGARAQDGRDYTRVIGRPEMLPYVAGVAAALNRTAARKFPAIEQSSAEGARRSFCTQLRDSPDVMVIPVPADIDPEHICGNNEPLVALPFGRQVFTLYTAPDGPSIALTREQFYRAIARDLPRSDSAGAEAVFEANPNKRWRDIGPGLPDLPIRMIGPPRRALQWLTIEDLVMRPVCLAIPSVAALARVDQQSAEQRCLARRFDDAIVYVDGAAYNIDPKIDPKGYELAINERRAMLLTQGAVPQAVDGQFPSFAGLNAGNYPLARRIVALIKVNRIDSIPNLRNFVVELTSPAAAGPKGYLTGIGIEPLPVDVLANSALKARFVRPPSRGTDKADPAADRPRDEKPAR